jgi:hypothetical protein
MWISSASPEFSMVTVSVGEGAKIVTSLISATLDARARSRDPLASSPRLLFLHET